MELESGMKTILHGAMIQPWMDSRLDWENVKCLQKISRLPITGTINIVHLTLRWRWQVQLPTHKLIKKQRQPKLFMRIPFPLDIQLKLLLITELQLEKPHITLMHLWVNKTPNSLLPRQPLFWPRLVQLSRRLSAMEMVMLTFMFSTWRCRVTISTIYSLRLQSLCAPSQVRSQSVHHGTALVKNVKNALRDDLYIHFLIKN